MPDAERSKAKTEETKSSAFILFNSSLLQKLKSREATYKSFAF